MRYVGIYKIQNFLLFKSMAKTNTGGLIDSKPFVKVDYNMSSELLFAAMNVALSNYKENVNNPTDWKHFAKEIEKDLKNIGVNSISSLNQQGNKFCLVEEDNKRLRIIPSNNDVKRKYFSHLPELAEYCDFNNNPDEMKESFNKALSKCT